MPTIHDSGYKKLFSNKVIFRQLIETFVKEDWVKDLDFDSCQTVDKSLEKIYTKNEEVRAMLIKALEKVRKQLVQKGKIEERREIARKMLMEGLEIVLFQK